MCGLYGGLGNVKSDKIKLLGYVNDSRGGDASGFYDVTNSDLVKGVDAQEKFAILSAHRQFKTNNIVCHSRKASVGHKTIAEAQPFNENGIFLSHNGTLNNWEELAKKTNINVKSCLTDSHFLTKALKNKNFNILNEYQGAATLVWGYDDEPDSIYIFKGASKKWSHSDVEEERPLYGIIIKNTFYWSSLIAPLITISESENDKPFVIETNKVIKVTKTTSKIKFTILKEINRADVVNVVTTYKNNYNYQQQLANYNKHKNKNNTNSSVRNLNNYYRESLIDINTRKYFSRTVPTWVKAKHIVIPDVESLIDADILSDSINYTNSVSTDIYFMNGRYVNGNGHPINNEVVLDMDTFTVRNKKYNEKSNDLFTYKMIRGIMMYSDEDYQKAIDELPAFLEKHNSTGLIYGTELFAEYYANYAGQPVLYFTKDNYNSLASFKLPLNPLEECTHILPSTSAWSDILIFTPLVDETRKAGELYISDVDTGYLPSGIVTPGNLIKFTYGKNALYGELKNLRLFAADYKVLVVEDISENGVSYHVDPGYIKIVEKGSLETLKTKEEIYKVLFAHSEMLDESIDDIKEEYPDTEVRKKAVTTLRSAQTVLKSFKNE